MPRINVEDSLWTDHRFISLCMRLQSIDTALGAVLRSWILAQKWYLKTPNRHVPLSEWNKQNLPKELFDCGLATITDEKWVHVAGADEQFGWLLKCVASGKKGGNLRSRNQREKLLGYPSEPLGEGKGIQASSSSSSSSSISFSDSFSNRVTESKKSIAPTTEAWETYRAEFNKKWQTDPVRNATVNSQLSKLLKRIPREEVPELIRFYLKSENPYYVKNMHKIGLLLVDAETVYAQMKSGIRIEDTQPGMYSNGKVQQTLALHDHNRRVKEEWLASERAKEQENNGN